MGIFGLRSHIKYLRRKSRPVDVWEQLGLAHRISALSRVEAMYWNRSHTSAWFESRLRSG